MSKRLVVPDERGHSQIADDDIETMVTVNLHTTADLDTGRFA
jgi:hypothetical protein